MSISTTPIPGWVLVFKDPDVKDHYRMVDALALVAFEWENSGKEINPDHIELSFAFVRENGNVDTASGLRNSYVGAFRGYAAAKDYIRTVDGAY